MGAGDHFVTDALRVWTIGHSNHSLERFIELLGSAEIEAVADVRSQPYSRFNQHFNQPPLKAALVEAGVRYVFLGEELGGRPPERSMYDREGHVLYSEVAGTERFRSGIDRVRQGASRWRVALMCSEEDPTDCHRRLLVARVLRAEGVEVVHVRGGGTAVTEDELATSAGAEQPSLFGGEGASWRSVRSVSPGTQPRSSSGR